MRYTQKSGIDDRTDEKGKRQGFIRRMEQNDREACPSLSVGHSMCELMMAVSENEYDLAKAYNLLRHADLYENDEGITIRFGHTTRKKFFLQEFGSRMGKFFFGKNLTLEVKNETR